QEGQIGIGIRGYKKKIKVPTELNSSHFNLENGDKIIKISSGWKYSLALSSSGIIYTWGWNRYEQLGRSDPQTSIPIGLNTSHFNLENGDKIIKISSGQYNSHAL